MLTRPASVGHFALLNGFDGFGLRLAVLRTMPPNGCSAIQRRESSCSFACQTLGSCNSWNVVVGTNIIHDQLCVHLARLQHMVVNSVWWGWGGILNIYSCYRTTHQMSSACHLYYYPSLHSSTLASITRELPYFLQSGRLPTVSHCRNSCRHASS
jgi:hypothetical protein